jgi:hypothetical protein
MDLQLMRERAGRLAREVEEARLAAALRKRSRGPGVWYLLSWEVRRVWGLLVKRLGRDVEGGWFL